MTRTRATSDSVPSWHRTAELASLRSREQHPGMAEAIARFDALADPGLRMSLAREIVTTRAAELTLAYRNVVAVMAGYKARGDAQGREVLMPQACVIFVVRRKWSASQPSNARAGADVDQCLPSRLLTWGPVPDQPARRALYAVPTDVQKAHRFAGAKAQSASCVVMHDAQFPLPGTLTCGVRINGAATSPLALSAMHVLSPAPPQPTPVGQTPFSDPSGGSAVRGLSTPWGGHLDRASRTAFDAQLARIGDAGWLNAAFSGWALSAPLPFVSAPDLFDTLAHDRMFRILVPDNHPQIGQARAPVLAQFNSHAGPAFTITYEFRTPHGLTRVALHHAQLLLLTIAPDSTPPIAGDSGSAVLCLGIDGKPTLAGMYIARGPNDAAGARQAYVLPAWQLFDPTVWSGLPPGTVSLQPTFTLP